jgi:signal peptidase
MLMKDGTQSAGVESNKPRRNGMIERAAVLVMLFAGTAVLIATLFIPMIIGGKAGVVTSGSMSPNIPVGHVIVTQQVDTDSLSVGDVVTYMPSHNVSDGLPIVHRIQSVLRGNDQIVALITKGDANANPDYPITPDMITGKVAYTVPFVGYPRYWVNQLVAFLT